MSAHSTTESTPGVIRPKERVHDRGAGRFGHAITAWPREGDAVGSEVGKGFGVFVDGKVPAIDHDVPLSADFAYDDIEPIHVVVADSILAFVVHRRQGGQHEIGLAGLTSRVRDGVEITPQLRDASCGSAVTVRLQLITKIRCSDRDMDHVGAKAMQKIDDFSRNLSESDEWIVAPDHGRPKWGVHAFQAFNDGSAKISAGLVGDQEYQPSVVTIDHVLSVG